LGKRKAAIIYTNNDWGVGLNNVFKPAFAKLGGTVVYEAATAQDGRDFRTELTKVKASGADVIYIPMYPASGIVLVKQAKELGLDLPMVGGDALSGEEFVKSPYSDGVMYTVAKTNLPEDFKSKVKTVNGFENLEVSIAGPLAYDAANVMFNAMKVAGTDKQAVMEALKRTSYRGVSADLIEFDSVGDLKQAIYSYYVIKNGESVNY
jgi:branched-chain amino acid transport system substrate-binding protein